MRNWPDVSTEIKFDYNIVTTLLKMVVIDWSTILKSDNWLIQIRNL